MSQRSTPDMLTAALWYAARGWPVFPLRVRGKTPLIPKSRGGRGCHDATTDLARIEAWWRQTPQANIGLACGRESLDALDIDKHRGGEETLARFETTYGKLPPGPWQRTPRGGRHLFFRGGTLGPLGADVFGSGLDTRSDGGYIVVSPSYVVTADYEGGYTLEDGDAPLPDPPEALLAARTQKVGANSPLPDGPSVEVEDGAVRKRLTEAGIRLVEIPEGHRHDVLLRIACSLRAREYDPVEILELVRLANITLARPAHPGSEVITLVRDIVQRYEAGPGGALRDAVDREAWARPLPLGLRRLADFPLHHVPAVLGGFASAAAESLLAAPELGVCFGLGVVSTLLQGKLLVRVRDDWTEPPTLWQCVSLPPGERKSPMQDEAVTPLYALQDEHAQANREEVRHSKAHARMLRARADELQRKAARAPADTFADLMAAAEKAAMEADAFSELRIEPPLLGPDVTSEGLAQELSRRGERVGIIHGEGADCFRQMAGYYQRSPNQSVWLHSWSGEPAEVTRKTTEPIRLQAPLLTLAIAVQPSVIRSVLSDEDTFRNRGVLDRMLFYVPEPLAGSRDHETAPPIPPQLRDEYARMVRGLFEFKPPAVRPAAVHRPSGQVVALSPSAAALMFEKLNTLEVEQRAGGSLDGVKGWCGKAGSHLARLALAHHALEWFDKSSDPDGMLFRPIELQSMESACALLDYFTASAKRVLVETSATGDAVMQVAQRAVVWIKKQGKREFKTYELREALHGGTVRTVADLAPALGLLEDHGYIRRAPKPEGKGRPRAERYLVNPLLFEDGA